MKITEAYFVEGEAVLRHTSLDKKNLLPIETRNCLVTAAQKGNARIVEMLLENCTNVNAVVKYEFKNVDIAVVSNIISMSNLTNKRLILEIVMKII